ncbi:hypothetical protein [Microtetraspora niveoalba]|uniref:hypothetical protein n=1 Tax=Microtetraspora niveoalba TaxID=46175 RepID=UPI00082D89B1|nr:hypothetical protein [Microtetraspora niveoalba]
MTIGEIGFEWALEGKRPGGHDDYELLSWSDARLGPEVFEEIRSRYATGISADLPQVTIAVAATRENERVTRHVVLAIQEWSGHRDATNRKIAYTRWFYVPYDELAAHRVSYEALYHALAGLPATPSPPLAVRVPGFDPAAVVPGPDALSAAALLLTGRPVCVVGADAAPMIERLRFLDTVAALLPYGMRSRLTAATWTSSTARHKIRLSFARHAPEDAHEVRWGYGAEITRRDSPAHVCLDLLTRSEVRLADMLRGLAGQTEPLSFGPADRPVAVRLLEHSGYPELLSGSGNEAEPEREPVPLGPEEPSDSGEPGPATERGAVAPASGAPARPAHEPGPERTGGVLGPAGTPPPARNARRLTLPVRSVLNRLGRGHGREPAPGATTGGTAAPTTPYRRAADEGPSAVPLSMRAALGGLEQADHGKRARSGRGPHAKVMLTVAFATAGITLICIGVLVLVRSPGGDPPTGPDVAGAEPGTVVIQAPKRPEDAFATNVVAEVVRRAGHRDDIRRSDTPAVGAPAEKPAVILAEGPDSALAGAPTAAPGFVQVGSIPVPNPDVLVYDIGLITPEKLRAAFQGQDKEVRVSLPDTAPRELAETLKRRYPSLRLEPAPGQDPLRALRDKTVQAAVVPRSAAGDDGYARLDGPDGLPSRTLFVFCNVAALDVLHDDLGRVAASVDPGVLASADFDSPKEAAARVVGAVLPPSRPPAVSKAGEQESDQGRGSFWQALALIAGGAVFGFLALLVAIWVPSRFEPRT